MGRTKLVVPVIAVAALALVSGCGSTVQTSDTATVGTQGLAAPSSTAPSAAAGGGLTVPSTGPGTVAAGTSATGAVGSGTTATGTTTAAGSGPITSGGGSNGLVPSRAPGVTNTKIYIGIPTSDQAGAADKAIGAAGAAPSYKQSEIVNAIVKYANSHGGFAGRQLEPIYYDYNLTDDASAQDQSACAHFTQDNKVAAIISSGHDLLAACAEKVGAVPLDANSPSNFQKYPHLLDPEGISLDRIGAVTVSGLQRAHYFSGKFGLVTWDDPRYRASVTNGYNPTLAKYGVKIWQTAYIMVPQAVGAISDMSAAVSSAVTKFRSLGIDHVIIQDGPAGVWAGGGLTLEFMNNAKSQRYYPRYGGNAYNIPGNGELPADEMDHELAILDSDSQSENDAGWHVNAQREKCFKIEVQAGLPPKNDEDRGLATQTCDLIFFLQRLVNSVPVVNADNVINAVSGLGTSFAPASVYGTRFFPGRRDGSDQVRLVEYFQSCNCLKYSGPPYRPD